jgi:hypothetical protein
MCAGLRSRGPSFARVERTTPNRRVVSGYTELARKKDSNELSPPPARQLEQHDRVDRAQNGGWCCTFVALRTFSPRVRCAMSFVEPGLDVRAVAAEDGRSPACAGGNA